MSWKEKTLWPSRIGSSWCRMWSNSPHIVYLKMASCKKDLKWKFDLIVAKLAKYSGGRYVGREGVTGMRSKLRSELNSRASNESTPRKYSCLLYFNHIYILSTNPKPWRSQMGHRPSQAFPSETFHSYKKPCAEQWKCCGRNMLASQGRPEGNIFSWILSSLNL